MLKPTTNITAKRQSLICFQSSLFTRRASYTSTSVYVRTCLLHEGCSRYYCLAQPPVAFAFIRGIYIFLARDIHGTSLALLASYHQSQACYVQETTTSTPLLSAASKLASVELKKVLRRVHVPQSKRDKKEALKPFGRMLAKVAAANPLSVAQTMIAQVYPSHLQFGSAANQYPDIQLCCWLGPKIWCEKSAAHSILSAPWKLCCGLGFLHVAVPSRFLLTDSADITAEIRTAAMCRGRVHDTGCTCCPEQCRSCQKVA